jgi:hypothetical protein
MTTPTTSIATVSKVETFVGHWVTIIKSHERLLLAVIATVLLWHFGNKAYDAYGLHLNTVVKTDNAQIAQIESNNAQIQAKLDQLKATVDANAKIDDAKIAAAKQKLVVTQKVDAALPLPELSQHWEDILTLSPGSITPQPNGTVAVTTDAAHATVNELEKVPALNDQLTATQDKLNGCTSVVTQQGTQIAGLKDDITAEKKGRADDAKQAKHDIRHAYLKGLKHGIIVGVVATVAATVAILH